MSDREALKIFSRQPVSTDMINYLVSTTNSIIQVKSHKPSKISSLSTNDILVSPITKKSISLVHFIKNLIKYSNVQTPTLMATLIYLNKLRNLLPANAIGMETTRHRIFLSSLILSAKCLNDSSPLNKHWTKYTDGLLNLEEVNMAERELISLLKWNVSITEDDLIIALQPFLIPIKEHLARKIVAEQNQKISYYRLSNIKSYKSPLSNSSSRSSSSSSINSTLLDREMLGSYSSSSLDSDSSPISPQYGYGEKNYTYQSRMPLQTRSANSLNKANVSKHDNFLSVDLITPDYRIKTFST